MQGTNVQYLTIIGQELPEFTPVEILCYFSIKLTLNSCIYHFPLMFYQTNNKNIF